ncbi:MAG: GNAT family N-acetyltransferase [Chloroflexota bacterium]
MMQDNALQFSIARPQDAHAWVQLSYPGANLLPPDVLTNEISQFNTTQGDSAAVERFICRLGEAPIARFELHRLDSMVELHEFKIGEGYLASQGQAILHGIIGIARSLGTILTIDFYSPAYSGIILAAGFKQNIRTRMMKSLTNYMAQPVRLPAGITLRHPIFDDEGAVAEMVYHNYKGTADEEMVSSSPAQAAAIIRAMFHNDYNLLDPTGSYLAVDKSGRLIGDVILGDASRSLTELQGWIMDISIAQEYRGQGLGKALITSAINAAKAHGYPRIGLIVTIGNNIAQSLYRSLGFEDYGEVMYEAILKLK